LRIYVGFRDADGVSRVGYVDVDPEHPTSIRAISERPVLDVGEAGDFDDNGVVPTAVVLVGDEVWLYYAGYQLATKVRFLAFGGLAISDDGGDRFRRHSRVPVLDRSDEGRCFRVPHTVLAEDGVWKVWYGAGSSWIEEGGHMIPSYDIRYAQSTDGVNFPASGVLSIGVHLSREYRVGRPFVMRHDQGYRMFYSVQTRGRSYRLGYAESENGVTWTRLDERLGLEPSREGWDSKMVAYPSVVLFAGHTYLFYNGNDMGRTGFGCAILEEDEV
jgi:predicted GH43/DUF377 family glycosyl hydrolase